MARGHQNDRDPPPAAPDVDVRAVHRRAEATPARGDRGANRTQRRAAAPPETGVTTIARLAPLVPVAAAAETAGVPAAVARATPVVPVRGVKIRVASARVVLARSLVPAAVRAVLVPGVMTRVGSAGRATGANRKAERGLTALGAVAAETTIAAAVVAAIAPPTGASLGAAAAPGTATVRRARIEAVAIALGVTEAVPRAAGANARADRRGRATVLATTRGRRRGVLLARRRRGTVAVKAIAPVPAVIDPTLIALRTAARQADPLRDLLVRRAANPVLPVWNSPQIWIFNNSRAACALSCAA